LAVKLRLRRMGKKRQPIYKVVAADERSPRDGKFIEAIGLYNPITDPATIDIKEERALYWLGVGGLKEEEVAVKLEEWQKHKEAKLASKVANKVEVKVKKEEKIEENMSEAEGTGSEEKQEEKAE